MLKIENWEVVGWEHAIRGARNPMTSWEKSDSGPAVDCGKCGKIERDGICKKEDRDCTGFESYEIGPNDYGLMTRLRNAGTDHRKFMRMITIYLDSTAPLYWWKEFDTYKVGTIANSCSTMHKIHAKEFTTEDFSHEHLIGNRDLCRKEDIISGPYCDDSPEDILNIIVDALNTYREKYLVALKTESETGLPAKDIWWQMIQLLPSSYNQKRTVMLNYEVLANIYKSRRNHKLDEWHVLCDWIEGLPYSELITGNSLEDIPICKDIMNEAKRRAKEEEK